MDARTAILDAAERRIRSAGFHGFSFREIAADVGIKSASVHYHFPTKADLGAAAAERYRLRFVESLGDPADARPAAEKLALIRQRFRDALAIDDRMCLCGALGAEIGSLPDPVAGGARDFFVACRDWLAVVLAKRGEPDASGRALRLLALLEGAMLVARALGDIGAFDGATGKIEDN